MGADNGNVCGKCQSEITGRAMRAKDTLYHEDGCFVCLDCGKDLRALEVYAKDGKLYCEADYMHNFVPKCAKCLEYITENCVRAMEKTWHARHFSCYTCDQAFTADTGFHAYEDKPYCEPCFCDVALPKCNGCLRPIKDKAIKAMNGQWHLTCFICKECKKSFEGQSTFYSVDNKPVCGPCAGVQS